MRVGQQGVGERLESGFAGDLRLGAPLGFEGEVDVLQPRLGIGPDDGGLEFGVNFPCAAIASSTCLPAILQFAQVAEAFFEVAQLGVIQRPGGFLAVAGDEGDR